MLTLKGRNVNALWPQGMLALEQDGVTADSRGGRVRVMPSPVVSVYEHPEERVLMDAVRDANPFFHLMESLWMLSGRDDASFLNRYVGDFGKRFAEHGDDTCAFVHGAYGHRWRKTFDFDQLNVVVEKLRANPDDRQAVIQMWDARPNDAGLESAGCDDLRGNFKDRPCNTHVYLRVREEVAYAPLPIIGATDITGRQYVRKVLDLTVLCRSNDIVWGAYGANAVHFSVLHEYLAGRIDVDIGKMYQFSNNFHGYEATTKKFGDAMMMSLETDPYATGRVAAMPMGTAWDKWDEDLAVFMAWHDDGLWEHGKAFTVTADIQNMTNKWFENVAAPVAVANWAWKNGHMGFARHNAKLIQASDWRAACVAWIERRMK